ncbi:pyridoxal phosphate-dependent transferase [Cantharellus anzutake]|uniref:pyridoxal phosphate-dependent transferase n=1 Tax=Cantharellus anzutake TaxID=1750568 RepID=UPI001904E52A|nr:pyridoxal phosphate-dependent transferase [Cantharellus anzutake]KAF8340619.1 pyridoxal phosphate-dependent transferase [Cantharellus anzutake]
MSFLDSETPLPDSPAGFRTRRYHFSTLCATVENPEQKDQYNASSVPIYQSATFKGMDGQYDYTRSGNPTRSHLEHHIAKISSARHAFAVSSGMAALDVITRLLKPGDEVIAGDDLYGGTNRLLVYLKTHMGVVVHHVDTTDTKSSNKPTSQNVDLAQIARDVKERAPNAVVVVDNTMMSPYLQRPLEHGADLVYDSATKYLSGHHDLMAGVIACNRDDLAKGIKTLAIRMDRQQTTAMRVASYLHDLGFVTHYPGLPNHPGRSIHERLANGTGAVLSFITGDKELSERIVGATRLWGISVSFGAVNSLISMPCLMSHASIDPAVRAARGLPEDLIRLCVGIEDADDLIEDLEFALIEAGAITQVPLPQGGVAFRRFKDPSEFGGLVGNALAKLTNEFMVSAPGKVILFGEHAVVYGVKDGKLHLSLPDLDGFEHEWDVEKDLPWSDVPSAKGSLDGALDSDLMEAIERQSIPSAASGTDPKSKSLRAAITAFLYLYLSLSTDKQRPSFTFAARSALPIGAGLGSSAAYSVCVATSLLLLYNRISLPTPQSQSLNTTASSPATSERSLEIGSSNLPQAFTDEVNRWAFVSEKVLHGNPSGVDNSVATYGGALAFTRDIDPLGEIRTREAGMEKISGFKSINFLLTDSKVPRDTKSLVTEPELVLPALRSIQQISDNAQILLATDPSCLPRSALLSSLEDLIDEIIRTCHSKSLRVAPFGLHTKLTGAGGGGCAVTLLPDVFRFLAECIREAGFVPYLTSIGGNGVGVLPTAPISDQLFASASVERLIEAVVSQKNWHFA